MLPFRRRQQGISLLEAVVYVAILTVLMVVLVSGLLSMTRGYAQTKVVADLERSASILFNRLSYELRSAERINTASSVLGTTSSVLVVEQGQDPTTLSRTFSLQSEEVRIAENGVDQGPLIGSPSVTVNSFVVTTLPTAEADAVTIQAQLTSQRGSLSVTRTYQNTIILKGSY